MASCGFLADADKPMLPALFAILLVASLHLKGVAASACSPLVGSREYKILLDETKFGGAPGSSNTQTAVRDWWNALAPKVTCCSIGGSSFDLRTSRTISFYDTQSTCLLNKNGYAYRERNEGGAREVTLKFRSPDRYISAKEDVSSVDSGSIKFEEDIAAPFVSKWSNQNTVSIGSSKNLNEMKDINDQFHGFRDKFGFSDSTPLVKVGGLTIEERVYEDETVDLGSLSASFSVTVWYTSASATSPVLVEASFKYQLASEDYTGTVVRNAKFLFEQMQSLTTWVRGDQTKTNFVYTYQPSFCT
jgi:hypothetical protein